MNDHIFHRGFKIDKLNRKIELFSNTVYNIKRYKYKFKEILKEGINVRNRAKFGLKYRI